MSLQSEHILFDKTGKINASETLRHLMNAIITMELGAGQLQVTQFEFVAQSTLVFKIKLSHVNSNQELADFCSLFKIDPSQVSVLWLSHIKQADLSFSNAGAITRLFQDMGYDALLNDEGLCLAYQVDLLQLLLTDALRKMMPAERMEFDVLGNLSATVVARNNVRYKLKNTNEICSYLKQACAIELPPYFEELLRNQYVVNLIRYTRYLLTADADGQSIFADNDVNSAEILEAKKLLSELLGLEGEQMERMFHATMTVLGNPVITKLLEQLCGLSPEYFIELQKLSGSADLHLIPTQALSGVWIGNGTSSASSTVRPHTILSVRAESDRRRVVGETEIQVLNQSLTSLGIFGGSCAVSQEDEIPDRETKRQKM